MPAAPTPAAEGAAAAPTQVGFHSRLLDVVLSEAEQQKLIEEGAHVDPLALGAAIVRLGRELQQAAQAADGGESTKVRHASRRYEDPYELASKRPRGSSEVDELEMLRLETLSLKERLDTSKAENLQLRAMLSTTMQHAATAYSGTLDEKVLMALAAHSLVHSLVTRLGHPQVRMLFLWRVPARVRSRGRRDPLSTTFRAWRRSPRRPKRLARSTTRRCRACQRRSSSSSACTRWSTPTR